MVYHTWVMSFWDTFLNPFPCANRVGYNSNQSARVSSQPSLILPRHPSLGKATPLPEHPRQPPLPPPFLRPHLSICPPVSGQLLSGLQTGFVCMDATRAVKVAEQLWIISGPAD